jgi:hypothetical protein
MGHKTQVVKVTHVTDTQIAVRLRCCEDSSTDSVHTFEVSPDHQESDLKAWIDERHKHVQGLHQKRDKATAFFESLKKNHSDD